MKTKRTKITRCSHLCLNLNVSKEQNLKVFFDNSKLFVQRVINDLWNEGVADFCPAKKRFKSPPKFLSSTYLEQFNGDLGIGGMLRQTLGAIALSNVTSVTEKLRKKQWVISQVQRKKDKGEVVTERDKRTLHSYSKEVNSFKKPPVLQNLTIPISRPDVVKFFIENKEGREFAKGTKVLRLSLAGTYGKILIPIPKTKHISKLEEQGFKQKMTAVTLYSPSEIGLIFEKEKTEEKSEGRTVGADQGISSVLTLSDGQVTSKNKHNQSLNDILKKLNRRKKGSEGFRRAQQHRKNFIHWSLNQMNFNGIKTLRLEHLKNVGKGHRTSRFLSSWTYPLIKEKLSSISQLEGFKIEEIGNKFRSQRCNSCGFVNKANRKGRTFKCKHCSHSADADLNASLNLELDLAKVPSLVFERQLNRKEGFFWNENGVFLEENVIPQDKKLDKHISLR